MNIARNLIIQPNATTPSTKIDVKATELQLRDSAFKFAAARGVNITVDYNASGVNGRTSPKQSGVWHVYVIAGESQEMAVVLDRNDLAPTLPEYYTHYAHVSSVIFTTGDVLVAPFYQRGNRLTYQTRQEIGWTNPLTSTTEAVIDLSSLVPGNALDIILNDILSGKTDATGSIDVIAEFRLITGVTHIRFPTFIKGLPLASTESYRLHSGEFQVPNVNSGGSASIYYLLEGGAEEAAELRFYVMGYTLPVCGN